MQDLVSKREQLLIKFHGSSLHHTHAGRCHKAGSRGSTIIKQSVGKRDWWPRSNVLRKNSAAAHQYC
eukprot:5351702-Karenia_brevis.AAC.1